MAFDHPRIYKSIKDSVASIGDWMKDNSEKLAFGVGILIFVIAFIISLVTVIGTWIDAGFWKALWKGIGAVIILSILYYVVMIVAGVGNYVVKGLSYAFKHIYVLELLVLVFLGLAYVNSSRWEIDTIGIANRRTVQTEQPPQQPQTTDYKCTASKALNVRMAPQSNAKAIGSIKSGEVVQVYEIVDGFARIKYNGQDGYASLQYLQQL